MKHPLKYKVLAVALANIFAVGAAQATNGYFSEGTGAKNRGMGGAGTALAVETGSIVMNPAAAVNMEPRIDIGVGLFNPSPRSVSISGNVCGPGCSLDTTSANESSMDYFLIPFYGQNFAIDNKSSWAVTVSALGGMNTDYETHPFAAFGASGSLGIDLKQVSIGGTYARKLSNEFSVGVTVSLIAQQFQAKGIGIFGGFGLSTDPSKMSDNGKSRSTGIGLNLGATYDVGDGVTVAFAYAPKVDMSEFDEYAGLFAEGGDFDIPSNYALGVAWEVNKDVLVSFDYRRINYTDVAAVSNDAQRLTDVCMVAPTNMGPAGNSDPTCLGGAQGAGFGWSDMDIFKLGVAWSQDADTTYRAGWNHGKSPIGPEDVTLNIIAPAVVEDHLSLGMTKKLDASSEITVDYIRTLGNSVTGDLPTAFGAGQATLEMSQNFLEVQYGKRF